MILTFGKYKGKSLTELSTGYLRTLLEKDRGLIDYVREAIKNELEGRTVISAREGIKGEPS